MLFVHSHLVSSTGTGLRKVHKILTLLAWWLILVVRQILLIRPFPIGLFSDLLHRLHLGLHRLLSWMQGWVFIRVLYRICFG